MQGDYVGMRLDFVDVYLKVPSVCPFAMPSLPNFHLPKQNRADRGTNSKTEESKSTKYSVEPPWSLCMYIDIAFLVVSVTLHISISAESGNQIEVCVFYPSNVAFLSSLWTK